MKRVAATIPAMRWLRGYDRATLGADVVAGLTVAVMLVPQAMAYAALAGMPPVTGLYAAIVPLAVYAVLGTSGQLAFGPVAIVSLLTASALAPLADGDASTYVTLAAVLALMVGGLLMILGVLRLGALVHFLSHSVISGFTSAAAIVIGFSQVGELLGIDADRSESFLSTIAGIVDSAGSANAATVAVGVGSVVVLLAGKRLAPGAPTALLVVAIATGATALLGLADVGVATLGEVPAGLPLPALPAISAEVALALLPSAVTIALIAYLEGISVAKAIALKTRQRVDADAELVAAGAANLAAGLFQAFPVAGGFSRTAVNHQAGARTPMASLVTAGVIAPTVAFLTPVFFHLPRAVLAAVIIVAVIGLIDVRAARHAWRIRRSDAAVLALTFAATLFIGVEPGIGLGVAASLALLLWRTATPHTAELGRVDGTGRFRNTERYPTQTDPAVAILRVDGPLYFASAEFVEDRVTGLVADRPELRAIVLDCSAVNDIDTDGEHALAELDRTLDEAGIALHLATVRGPVRDVLEHAGTWEDVRGRIHPAVPAALEALNLPRSSLFGAGILLSRAPTRCIDVATNPSEQTRSTVMSYGRTITLALPYEAAVTAVKETFAEHGFGTLTEIDVRATLRNKLGEEMEDYVILGVCNPNLAHRALAVDRAIGLLLPCTVVVRATDDGTVVQALDPQVMVSVPGLDDLQPIADEAGSKINAALDELAR